MTFKEGYRLEKVYFENIYTLLNMLKSVDKNNVDMNTVKELLDNAIADNESIILIYKNLGELYSEVADNYSKLLADLEALKENLESWKDVINEKIDDLNNYIMSLIRDIEQRLDSLEQRMSDAEEAIDSLEDRMDTAEADIDALEGRMDTAEDDIDALEGRMDTAEDDIDSLEGRMDTAEDDIDDLETNKQDKLTAGNGITIDSNNEISVDTSVVQPKLTEGFGVDIDSNNEISVDTNDVQEKLIAGQNITFTPDATDPTKTIIDAQGGASYTAGHNIDITNDVINNVSVFPMLGSYGLPDSGDLIDVGRTVGTGLYNKNATFKRVLKNQSNKYKKLYVSSGGTQYSDSSFVSDNTIKTFLNNNPMTYEEFYLKYKLTIFAGDTQSGAFSNATPIFTPYTRSVKVFKKGGLWFIDDTNTGIESHIYDISLPNTKYLGIQLIFTVFFNELESNTNCGTVADYFLNKMSDIANLVCFVTKNY